MAQLHFFLAAWPSREVRSGLRLRLAKLGPQDWPPGGRCEMPARWHLTLSYLGAADPAPLQRRLDDCWPGPFPITLRLDRMGAFHDGRVLWLGAQEVPAALAGWRQGCLGEDSTPANPFLPHVTLLRAPRPWPWVEQAIRPLRWTLEELALVASVDGQYTLLRRWRVA